MQRIAIIFLTLLVILLGSNATVLAELPWEPVDIELTSTDAHPWHTFPVQVTFTHADNQEQIVLDGYWNGDNSWIVRFAPTRTGTWRWTSRSEDPGLNAQSGNVECTAPAPADIAANPNLRGHLVVSQDNRRLEYADGAPFFWLGDTNWSISADRCGVVNRHFYTYVDDRKEKRFNLIQTMFYSRTEYNEGGYPFPDNQGEDPGNGNFQNLNPAYFQHVDTRMAYLFEQGFVVAAHPDWLSQTQIDQNWAGLIFRYLLARYGAYNTVWSLSGEYQYSRHEDNQSLESPGGWEQLGNDARTHNHYNQLMTIHPTGGGPEYTDGRTFEDYSSSGEFHNSDWLGINWIQTYGFVEDVSESVYADYERTPHKPVIMAEPGYEYFQADSWLQQPNYTEINGNLSRLQAWSAILCGAAGHTYGSWGLWQFYDPNHEQPGIGNNNVAHWTRRINGEGAQHMRHVRDFFTGEDLDWTRLTPNRDCLQVDGQTPPWPSQTDFTPPHCAAEIGQTYVAYIPAGNHGKAITMTNLEQGNYHARWFNPRDGSYTPINNGPAGVGQWNVPALPDNQDWVLFLSSANN